MQRKNQKITYNIVRICDGCSKAYTFYVSVCANAGFVRLSFRMVVAGWWCFFFSFAVCLHNGARIITCFYYFYSPMKRSMLTHTYTNASE